MDDLLKGYTENYKHFDKLCEEAAPILGKVNQCGIMELDSTGHALIVANRPDFGEVFLDKKGYTFDPHFVFSKNFQDGMMALSSREEYELLYLNAASVYGKNFGVHEGFIWQEKVSQDIQRLYFFVSDSPDIYNDVVNNIEIFKRFLKYFREKNKDVIKIARERKVKISDSREQYFIDDTKKHVSKREQINSLLHTVGLLDKNKNISKREWQCIELLNFGHSANKTGEILGLSQRTIETHFNNVKDKLKVNRKSEILEIIN